MKKKYFVGRILSVGGSSVVTVPVEIPTEKGKTYQFSIEVED